MMAGAEPEDLDELSEEGHRHLEAYVEWVATEDRKQNRRGKY